MAPVPPVDKPKAKQAGVFKKIKATPPRTVPKPKRASR